MADATSEIDQELDAIRTILAALTPLSSEARVNAIDYALRRLSIELPRRGVVAHASATTEGARPPAPPVLVTSDRGPADIRTLADEKRPRSAIEMAALVAYYLGEMAAEGERKDTVTTEDLRRYFKQANFPLPGAIQYTLGNAAAAGFFESAGRGEYKITAVGHNLVAHVLPTTDEPVVRPRKPRKSPVKKVATKKAPAKKVPAAKRASAPSKGQASKKSAPRKR